MNKLFILVGVLIVLTAGLQVYNTLTFESKMKPPTLAEQLNPYDLSIRSDTYKNVTNPYAAYAEDWRENSNVPFWIPLSILIMYFGYVGYIYYDDWLCDRA